VQLDEVTDEMHAVAAVMRNVLDHGASSNAHFDSEGSITDSDSEATESDASDDEHEIAARTRFHNWVRGTRGAAVPAGNVKAEINVRWNVRMQPQIMDEESEKAVLDALAKYATPTAVR
jgi:hypothetical protein